MRKFEFQLALGKLDYVQGQILRIKVEVGGSIFHTEVNRLQERYDFSVTQRRD